MLDKFLKPIHPSWGFYAAVWGIIAGIVAAVATGRVLVAQFWVVIVAGIVILLSLSHSSPLILAVIFLAGFLLGNYRVSDDLASKNSIQRYYNQTVVVEGKLSEDPDDSKGSTALRLKKPRIRLPTEAEFTDFTGVIYVTLASKNQLERSDIVTLEGKLGEGFGNFLAKMSRPRLKNIARASPGDVFAQFKHWFVGVVRQFIPSPEVDLGLGYLMGQKSGLSEEFAEQLRAVGMTHVVVASGAHLAILTGAAKKIFGKISKFAGLLFSLLMIAAFVMVVGFTPSMTRAALVASLSLLVGYVGRKFTPLRLIGFVAMLTLMIDPSFLLNLGWQLSFASFTGILVLAPRLARMFYGGKNPPWLASMLLTSLATCLICAPILIYNFGSISLLAFVANLVILPTLPYAMLGMLLTGVTSVLAPMAGAIAWLTTLLLDLHIWLVEFLSEKTMFILEIPAEDGRIFLIYLPMIVLLIIPEVIRVIKRKKEEILQ